MIDTYGELLREFMRAEQRKLDDYDLKHGPTIGAMYEGLSRRIVEAALPKGPSLRVVTGFVTEGLGCISRQIDCMLVQGQGDPIPHTGGFKWHVRDVIAVLEIKKTLYARDIVDAIPVFQSVRDCNSSYLQSIKDSDEAVDIESAEYAFAQATKIASPGYDNLDNLSFSLQMIFHCLVMEQVSPICIVLGYSGFSSEHAFRQGIAGLLEDAINARARLGVPSFPQLIISGEYSAVKANGQPFIGSVEDEVWEFMVSCAENPVVLLLELIWTRLQILFGGTAPWGDDLETQVMHRFLGGKAVEVDGRLGWEMIMSESSDEQLASGDIRAPWSPSAVTLAQATILTQLFEIGPVDTTRQDFIDQAARSGATAEKMVSSLLATDLVAMDGTHLVSTARSPVTAMLPDGRIVVGDDNTGRVSRWLAEHGGVGPPSSSD